jgi:hypothetical protein
VFAQTSSEDRTQFGESAWAEKKQSCVEGLNSAKPQGGVTMRTTYLLGAELVLSLPCFAQTAGRITGVVTDPCALLRAGVDARLMVFDAMPHGFWYAFGLGIQGSARSAGELP